MPAGPRTAGPLGLLARAVAVCTAVAVCAAGLVAAAPAPAGADPRERKRQVDGAIDELQEALAGTSAELRAAYAALAATQAQLPVAQAALDAALVAEAAAEQHDADLAVRLEAARTTQQQARAELEASAEDIAGAEADIGRLAGEVYRSGVANPHLSIVLGAQSPDDFATRSTLADTVLRSRVGALNDLTERKAQQVNAQARLDAVEVEVADLRQQAAEALAQAEAARAAATEHRRQVDALLAQQTQQTAAISARKAEEEARMAAYAAEQAALEAELRRIAAEEARRAAEEARRARERGRSVTPPPSGGGSSMARPVNGYITSHFGYRIHPIYGTRRLHAGTDFGAACGTPVYAAASGSVVSSGWAGGYGNRIIVSHGGGLATTYNHLSGYARRSGSVQRGQVIGYVGTTGSSTGCHLHFEVRRNGTAVNPMGYL
jgi:murein DD-endopeptidase MepM/ murein hydrolase activator NlpD